MAIEVPVQGQGEVAFLGHLSGCEPERCARRKTLNLGLQLAFVALNSEEMITMDNEKATAIRDDERERRAEIAGAKG